MLNQYNVYIKLYTQSLNSIVQEIEIYNNIIYLIQVKFQLNEIAIWEARLLGDYFELKWKKNIGCDFLKLQLN